MDGYYPVDCGFHNLEALSTLQRTCQIIYCNMVEETVKVQDQIDIYAANKTHFEVKDGTEIRLDRLISVDGKPTFGSDYGNFCSQPITKFCKACYCRWNGRKHHWLQIAFCKWFNRGSIDQVQWNERSMV